MGVLIVAKKKNGQKSYTGNNKKGKKKHNRSNGGRAARRNQDTVRNHNDVADEGLRKHLRFMDIRFDQAYQRDGKRINEDGSKNDAFGVITKEETFKQYRNYITNYVKWAYQKYGELALDFRNYKKSWAQSFFDHEHEGMFRKAEQKLKGFSVSTVDSYVSALNKFEEILEKQWQERTGQKRSYGIINTQDIRYRMDQAGLHRDIEYMKKSYKLKYSETKLVHTVEEKLSKMDPEYGKLWRGIIETGSRIDAAMHLVADDIRYKEGSNLNGIDFRFAKAGLNYTNFMVNAEFLKELNNAYKSGNYTNRKLFEFKNTKNNAKKMETAQRRFQEAVKKVGEELGIPNLTPHSGRAYYSDKLYRTLHTKSEKEIDKIIDSNPQQYQGAIANLRKDKRTKRLYNEKSYKVYAAAKRAGFQVQKPSQWVKWKETYDRTGKLPAHLDHEIGISKEEKIAIITTVSTGHKRISILNYYLKRTTARKEYGSKAA